MKRILKHTLLLLAAVMAALAQTTPAPTPGNGGPAFAYQQAFDTAYYAAQAPAKQAFYNGRAWAQNQYLPQLTQAQINALTVRLLAQGYIVDEQIDFLGMDPYSLMYFRQAYGNTWVPAGLGNVLGTVEPPINYTGPMPAGAIRVSTLIVDYPPFPVPPPGVVLTPPTPLAANPVGIRILIIQPSRPGYVGDVFRCAVPSDGYDLGMTWTGTSGPFTGTWIKGALEAGLMTVWTKTQ